MARFEKCITPNDLGLTESHQYGLAIPVDPSKGQFEVFPDLGLKTFNPSCQLKFVGPDRQCWQLRFIYYNGKKMVPPQRTRNEYRLTKGATGDSPKAICESLSCRVGDTIIFSRVTDCISLAVSRCDRKSLESKISEILCGGDSSRPTSNLDNILDEPRGGRFGDEDFDEGWVYVCRNPSMPNVTKIGHTKNKPEIRMKQLYTTGVPVPFELVGCVRVKDPKRLEEHIHDILDPVRTNPQREFFELDAFVAFERVQMVAEVYSSVRPL